MSAGNSNKSIREQVIAIFSPIFAVILISIIAIPQVLEALSQSLFYWSRRKNKDVCRGKFAVVTNGASPLGKRICIKLAHLGCNLVIVEKSLSAIEDVMNQTKCIDVKVYAFEADVKKLEEVHRVVDFLQQKVDSIDYLILATELNTSIASINENFQENFFLTLTLIDQMQKQNGQGQIVSISPSTGVVSDLSAYSTVKNGIYDFMRSVREHLSEAHLNDKIKIKSVIPCSLSNGKLLSNFINNYISFLPLTINEIADEVIDGINKENSIIEVPSNLMCLKRLTRYFYKRFQVTSE